MKCPNCDQLLQITERQNIEIDYCPQCRGVWLDKGELDKVINFSNQQTSQVSKKYDDDIEKYRGYNSNQQKSDNYSDNQKYPNKYNKKKSFLGDLFDFG